MKQKKKLYLLPTLSILWAVLIFVLCSLPPDGIPHIKIPYIDKIAHFGFFFVESVLLSLAFRSGSRLSFLRIVILVTMLAFVYGGVIEIMQNEYFNRVGDPYDLLADLLGGLFGGLFGIIIFRKKKLR
jgi:VanZ family protein